MTRSAQSHPSVIIAGVFVQRLEPGYRGCAQCRAHIRQLLCLVKWHHQIITAFVRESWDEVSRRALRQDIEDARKCWLASKATLDAHRRVCGG